MATNPYADGCAFIEGKYIPIADARIPILDTGFTRSDLTYDVVAVWKGKFFRLDDHLKRFENSYTQLRMNSTISLAKMREILFECVRRTGIRNAYVEMILSRGIDEDGSRDPRRFRNCFYAYAIPYVWIVKPEDQKAGIHLIIAEKTIRIPPMPSIRQLKISIGGIWCAEFMKPMTGAGTRSCCPMPRVTSPKVRGFNIFVYCRDSLLTPERGVLKGITRQTIIDLAEEQGIPVRLDMFGADVLMAAEEVFLTSTAGGVMPVTSVNGRTIGDGKPGKITTLIQKRYWEAHDEGPWVTPVDYPD